MENHFLSNIRECLITIMPIVHILHCWAFHNPYFWRWLIDKPWKSKEVVASSASMLVTPLILCNDIGGVIVISEACWVYYCVHTLYWILSLNFCYHPYISIFLIQRIFCLLVTYIMRTPCKSHMAVIVSTGFPGKESHWAARSNHDSCKWGYPYAYKSDYHALHF